MVLLNLGLKLFVIRTKEAFEVILALAQDIA